MVETVVTLGNVLNSLKQDGDKFQIGSYALAGTNTAANYPVACTNDFTAQTRRQISMRAAMQLTRSHSYIQYVPV
jgi:hypothetical protein